MIGLDVGTIVMHKGRRKRIIDRFVKCVFSSVSGFEYFYKLKCMETGIEINATYDDIESIVKKEPKFTIGQKVLVNFGLLEGKECEILKVGKLFDNEINYEIFVSGDVDPLDVYLVKEDYLEMVKEKEKNKNFKYSLGDIVKCEKNGRIGTVVNASKSVRDRYKLEFHDGYTMWVYSYEVSLVGSEVTAKDDKLELSKEDYFSILSLAVDLGDKDLLDTYKDKVNGI